MKILGFKTEPLDFLVILKLTKTNGLCVINYDDFWINNHFNYYLINGITNENGIIKGEVYDKLIYGLDKQSRDVVNKIINNIYKTREHKIFLISEFYDEETLNEMEIIRKARKNYKKYGILPINHREDSVFFYYNGLKDLNLKIDLSGKDIVDCGAFIGDSDLVFDKEIQNYNKIYCFEPAITNYKLLEKTIKLNKKQNKFIPVNLGVGDKNETLMIKSLGSESSVKNEGLSGKNESVEVVKLDDYIAKNNILPGLIKWDIEGFELESVKGAEQSIKEYKPLLLISIYHTGKDFFEIKPLIESWNLGYKFKIVHNNPFSVFAETVLICYLKY